MYLGYQKNITPIAKTRGEMKNRFPRDERLSIGYIVLLHCNLRKILSIKHNHKNHSVKELEQGSQKLQPIFQDKDIESHKANLKNIEVNTIHHALGEKICAILS